MTSCAYCRSRKSDQRTHSFQPFCTNGDITFVYTSPAAAPLIKTPEEFAVFKEHLEPFRTKKWTWIMDFQNTGVSHYTDLAFIQMIMTYLDADHRDTLQSIWVLNSGYLLHGVIAALQAVSNNQILKKTHLRKLTDLPAPLIPILERQMLQRQGQPNASTCAKA